MDLTITDKEVPVEQLKLLSVIQHLRDPQNLVTYLVFTAWCKFMGISSYEQDMYACRTCYHNLKIKEYNSPSSWVPGMEEE